MADYADDSERTEQALRDAALRLRKREPHKGQYCAMRCGERSAVGSSFCSIDCRDDYEHVQKLKKRGC